MTAASADSSTVSGIDPQRFLLPEKYRAIQSRALIVGGFAALACVFGFLGNRQQFFQSYLVGWMFWLAIALGSLAWLMINHLTAGGWGIVMRRSWEAAARTLPFLLLLALPFSFGMADVFSWAGPEAAHDPLIQKKAAYLNVPFFWLRALVSFGVLSALALVLSRYSAEQDRSGAADTTRRLRLLSGPGLVIYVLCCSLVCWDWLMSLDPHWFSSLYGIYFLCMTALSSLAATVILSWHFAADGPMRAAFRTKFFHDQGKLCLALTMFWAYMTLSQFLVTWSGNVPEFVTWYIDRNTGGWKAFSVLVVVLHFFVPYALLLSAALKRRPALLAAVALYLLAVQWLDFYWQTAPTWHQRITAHWLDLATIVAVGGLWLGCFLHQLRRRTLLPVNDPAISLVVSR